MENQEEIWNYIKGYNNKYQVSNLGRVKSFMYRNERIMKPTVSTNGYYSICLCKRGIIKNVLVHRLVAESFIENKENKETVNHINCNKLDNRVENLEWATRLENQKHASINGLLGRHMIGKFGKHHNTSKKVNQMDLDGTIIKTWDSISDAQRELGFSHSHISSCCTGRIKTCKGYKWGFAAKIEEVK